MAHILRTKKPLLTRVRRIQGQAQALERAIDSDDDCLAVLQQIAALRGAVNGLMAEVLDGHIRDHLGAPDLSEAQRADEVEAVISALRSYLK